MMLPEISPLLIVVVCGLCLVGFVLLMVVQLIGGVFDIFFGLFEFVGGIIEGGPIAWCGCLVLIGGCGLCAGTIYVVTQLLSTCGTPDAVNFCRLF